MVSLKCFSLHSLLSSQWVAMTNFDKYIQSQKLNQPASDTEICDAEITLGIKFQNSYREFLKLSNGAEGMVGESYYLILWTVDELAEVNIGYGVDEFASGLLLFGSSGGGTAFGFDKRYVDMRVIAVPFMCLDLDEVRVVSATFEDFLSALYCGAEI